MKITCEYCGALIDTDKASLNCCPNCGASFEHNKQLKESNEQQKEFDKYMLEQERIETEEKQLRLERQKNAVRFQKQGQKTANAIRLGCIIPVFIFVGIIMLTIVGSIFNIVSTQKEMVNNISNEEQIDVNEGKMFLTDESPLAVNFNETATFQRTTIIADKCEIYDYPWKKPQEGYMYIRVHITVINTFTEPIDMFNEVYATYEKDGIQEEAESPTISSDDLDTKLKRGEIREGMSKQGWVYFTVPKNINFVIHIDDNLKITIKPINVEMSV